MKKLKKVLGYTMIVLGFFICVSTVALHHYGWGIAISAVGMIGSCVIAAGFLVGDIKFPHVTFFV